MAEIIIAHHAYFPGYLANTKQIINMIDGISSLSDDITCIFPCSNVKPENFDFNEFVKNTYELNIKVRYVDLKLLPYNDSGGVGFVKFYKYFALRINSLLFTLLVFFNPKLKNAKYIYTRHTLLAYILSFFPKFKKKIVTEFHDIPDSRWELVKLKKIVSSCNYIWVISEAIKKDLEIMFPNFANKICIAPDAISIDFRQKMLPAKEAKCKINIKSTNKVITYCGSLHKFNDPKLIVDVFDRLGSKDIHCWIIGGSPIQVNEYRSKNEYVKFFGNMQHKEIPLYLSASDILVVSYVEWHKRQAVYSSPLKIFEYIAAKRPIVAPNLPSVRNILVNMQDALLFEAGNADSMFKCINTLLNDSNLCSYLSYNAFKKYGNYTWSDRAKSMFVMC